MSCASPVDPMLRPSARRTFGQARLAARLEGRAWAGCRPDGSSRCRCGRNAGRALSRKVTTSFTTQPVEGRRTSELAGQVVDTAGNPLRNAIVFASTSRRSQRLFRTRTDASGKFRMLVPPGHYEIGVIGDACARRLVRRTGYLFATRGHRPARQRPTAAALRAARAAAIAGSVTDVHGHPLAGVHVSLTRRRPISNTDFGFAIGGSAQSGTARDEPFRALPGQGAEPGAEVPCFDAAGFVSRCATTSVAARAGQVAPAPVASLAASRRRRRTHRGTVVDAESHPVSHAVVLARARARPAPAFEGHRTGSGRFTLRQSLGRPVARLRRARRAQTAGSAPTACRTVTVVADRTRRSSCGCPRPVH